MNLRLRIIILVEISLTSESDKKEIGEKMMEIKKVEPGEANF